MGNGKIIISNFGRINSCTTRNFSSQGTSGKVFDGIVGVNWVNWVKYVKWLASHTIFVAVTGA
jgi:hypothetical protein